MIVGTAGHIDHGKTSLVKQLTGVDTDRLPEEKRRGITIELGFAFMDTPSGSRIGFIDMPGHEKLVKTMVAGAVGIDFAMLLIAADDGIMPQTLEHAQILVFLGVANGLVVITKTDRVDQALLAQREVEARHMLSQLNRPTWGVQSVSSHTGEGVERLRDALVQAASVTELRVTDNKNVGDPAACSHREFRMPVDRAFTLNGVGTVVTGSVAAGRIEQGQALCFAHRPQALFRIRSLRVHDLEAPAARAGERCAMALVGLERTQTNRGQVVCDPAIAQLSARIDVRLRVAHTEAKPLRSGTVVHVHLGCEDSTGMVTILESSFIAPGEEGLAQLVLQKPMSCWQQDRLIVRDAGAQRTIAGGCVLDPQGPSRHRQSAERVLWLTAQCEQDLGKRLKESLRVAAFGFDSHQWLRSAGIKKIPVTPSEENAFLLDSAQSWIIAVPALERLEIRSCEWIKSFHTQHPEEVGPDLAKLRRAIAPTLINVHWSKLVTLFVSRKSIQRRGAFFQLPVHAEQLQQVDRIVAQKVLPLILIGGFDPPWVRDLSESTSQSEAKVRSVLARMSKAGDAFQVVKDLYYHPDSVKKLAELARSIEHRDGQVRAATFRDATVLGRKRAIQILEFFDRIGFLRRIGDVYRIQPGSLMFLDTPVTSHHDSA
jgi:selenocysteine-specific elongation factor